MDQLRGRAVHGYVTSDCEGSPERERLLGPSNGVQRGRLSVFQHVSLRASRLLALLLLAGRAPRHTLAFADRDKGEDVTLGRSDNRFYGHLARNALRSSRNSTRPQINPGYEDIDDER